MIERVKQPPLEVMEKLPADDNQFVRLLWAVGNDIYAAMDSVRTSFGAVGTYEGELCATFAEKVADEMCGKLQERINKIVEEFESEESEANGCPYCQRPIGEHKTFGVCEYADEATSAEVVDILALADCYVPFEVVEAWSNEQRAKAAEWASAEYNAASDNDTPRLPKPEFLKGVK